MSSFIWTNWHLDWQKESKNILLVLLILLAIKETEEVTSVGSISYPKTAPMFHHSLEPMMPRWNDTTASLWTLSLIVQVPALFLLWSEWNLRRSAVVQQCVAATPEGKRLWSSDAGQMSFLSPLLHGRLTVRLLQQKWFSQLPKQKRCPSMFTSQLTNWLLGILRHHRHSGFPAKLLNQVLRPCSLTVPDSKSSLMMIWGEFISVVRIVNKTKEEGWTFGASCSKMNVTYVLDRRTPLDQNIFGASKLPQIYGRRFTVFYSTIDLSVKIMRWNFWTCFRWQMWKYQTTNVLFLKHSLFLF